MFVANGRSGHTPDGQQWARGAFLIVFDDETAPRVEYAPGKFGLALLACVRSVRMTQLGHFMMALTKVGPHVVSLSGAYGGDGLPCHFKDMAPIPDDARPFLHPVPDDLIKAFWNGGGHNTSGSEGPALRQWARENITKLRGRAVPVDEVIYECGICDCYHPWNFSGDCRDNANRYASPEEYAAGRHVAVRKVVVRSWTDREAADNSGGKAK